MIRARLRAESAAKALAAPDQGRDGRWAIYTGGEMVPHTDGINGDKPCRLVIDLTGLQVPRERILALADHRTYAAACALGYWDGWTVDTMVAADLHITRPASEAETAALGEQVAIAAHVRCGVPLCTSIGVEWAPDDAEPVPPTATVEVNGRSFAGAGDLPLFIVRRSRVSEASIVPFGADPGAYRIAAAVHPTATASQDPSPMADEAPAPKTDDTAIAKAAEAITAAAGAITAAVAKLADISVQPPPNEKKDGDAQAAAAGKQPGATMGVAFATPATGAPGASAGSTGANAEPTTFINAMAKLQAENPKLIGAALHAAASKRYPQMAPKTCIARKA